MVFFLEKTTVKGYFLKPESRRTSTNQCSIWNQLKTTDRRCHWLTATVYSNICIRHLFVMIFNYERALIFQHLLRVESLISYRHHRIAITSSISLELTYIYNEILTQFLFQWDWVNRHELGEENKTTLLFSFATLKL